MMKWYENVDMLKQILENNKKELEEVEYGSRVWNLLTDESNLIKNHLELIAKNQELKIKTNKYLELQKENQELIKKADCCLWKECNKISQENQELKLDNKILKGMYEDIRTDANFYMSKCEKLEKVIEWLKEIGGLHLVKQVNGNDVYYALVFYGINIELEENEYKDLKEVLEND